ncbi:MAG TPA: RHS repeat-associated core domain-containing protein [Fimbriimonadaceae bacterium]|nr:RHS repeat-associated core domain-containing protein [Fimbriimonadaceae bacterium]
MAGKGGKRPYWPTDPNQQLRAESRWSAKTPGTLSYRTEYGYDGNGNRTVMFEDGVKVAYTIGNNNEMTEAGTDDITYDFYGNTVFINSANSYDLAYDYQRHLLEMYENESLVFRAEYDGNGRRMRAEYNDSGIWTNFVHCELTGEILAEYTLVSSTFTIKCLNTYGIGLISSNRESTKRYFHFDGLGSTVALTDASENITDTYVYSAFGNLLSSTGSSVNPYRYVGQWGYYDDGAMGCPFDMLLLGVRYYVPEYGRFLTWDPVRQVNLYWYVRNSSTRWTDRTGEALDWPCVRKCLGQAAAVLVSTIGACLAQSGWACKLCLKFGIAGCVANPPMCLGIIHGCTSLCGREVLGCAAVAGAAALTALATCLAGCYAEGPKPLPLPAPSPSPLPVPPPSRQDEPGMQILPYPFKEKVHGPAA